MYLGPAGGLDDVQAAADAPHVVRFAGDHLPHGLPVGLLKLASLALDPREALDDRHAYGVFAEVGGRCDANVAHRRVHADVQVLDALVDNIDGEPANGEVVASTGTHAVP
jgi:hypothetical protein